MFDALSMKNRQQLKEDNNNLPILGGYDETNFDYWYISEKILQISNCQKYYTHGSHIIWKGGDKRFGNDDGMYTVN